mmetsp:Transcript_22951/g.23602  ORF Transcript_22951/g.23602 Transcript_22951/m.23602 type:complete len:311 (+) Transcript_22951:78-1010(+)
MFHLRQTIKRIPLRSRYISNPIIFSDVTAQINENNSVVNKLSFKLEKGERIGLSGSNEEGRSAVIQLLQGKVKPQKGFINFLDEKTVVTLNTTLPKNVLSLSVKDYLAKLSSSSDEVNKALNEVELVDLRVVRTINTLSSSQIFRLGVASLLLTKPDVILLDKDFPEVSYNDSEFLANFLKSNPTQSIVVVNSHDEDFVQKVVNTVIEVEAFDVPATQYYETYANAKTLSQQKKKQLSEAAAAALRAEFRRKAEADASPEAIEALNQIGYKNANEAVSQEDYIRVMLLAIALHPPALIALYSFGVFDAIV